MQKGAICDNYCVHKTISSAILELYPHKAFWYATSERNSLR